MTTLNVTPGVLDLVLYHGDAATVQVQLSISSGSALSLPSSGWSAQVKTRKTSDDVAGVITVDGSGAEDGVLVLEFPLLDVGQYVYDVQLDDGGIRTYVGGRITVTRDVTG